MGQGCINYTFLYTLGYKYLLYYVPFARKSTQSSLVKRDSFCFLCEVIVLVYALYHVKCHISVDWVDFLAKGT